MVVIRKTRPFAAVPSVASAVALAVPLLSGDAHGQGDTGFPTGAGRTRVALSYAWDVAGDYKLGGTSTSLAGDLERRTASISLAHGFTDRLDAWLAGSYGWNELAGDPTVSDESGLADGALGVRWHVFDEPRGPGRLALTLAPAVKIPLASYDTGTVAALGDGQTDLRLRAVARYQWANSLFLALESGYDVRLGAPDDEVPLHLTVGGFVAERVHLSAFYSRVDSLGGATLAGVVGGGGQALGSEGSGPGGSTFDPVEVEEDVETVGLGAFVFLESGWGFGVDWRTTIGGSNTAEFEGLALSLVHSL